MKIGFEKYLYNWYNCEMAPETPEKPITKVRERQDSKAARETLADDTARGLTAGPQDPYVQARKLAESLGLPFMSHV